MGTYNIDNCLELMGNSILYLIGKNGSGKTSYLKKLLKESNNNVLLIDENGLGRLKNSRGKVSVRGNKYIYDDSRYRGASNTHENTEELINEKAIHVVQFIIGTLEEKISKDLKNTSSGILKIREVFTTLISYNLNTIELILFDEPDIYLDDQYLKILSLLLRNLNSRDYKIIINTHSSRLLEIMNVKIDDLFLYESYRTKKMYNLKFTEVKQILMSTQSELDQIFKKKSKCPDGGIRRKISISEEFASLFVKNQINNSNFYRALFYNSVYLAEGNSEELIFRNIEFDEINENNIFIAHGKPYLAFYINLFLALGKNVIAIYDTDYEDTVVKDSFSITLYIRGLKYKYDDKLALVECNPNLEDEFFGSYDPVTEMATKYCISKSLADERFLKPYRALEGILYSSDERKENFIKKIIAAKNDRNKYSL